MNSINCNNNVNFTARLNISEMKNPTKWKAIAKRFEAETAKKDYDIVMSSRASEGMADEIAIEGFSPTNDYYHCACLGENATKTFVNSSEDNIIKTLKKFLNIFRDQDKKSKICDDFMMKLEKDDTFNTLDKEIYENGTKERLFDKIYAPMITKIEADHANIIDKAQMNDKILQGTEFIY
jgi:hypothetical protein